MQAPALGFSQSFLTTVSRVTNVLIVTDRLDDLIELLNLPGERVFGGRRSGGFVVLDGFAETLLLADGLWCEVALILSPSLEGLVDVRMALPLQHPAFINRPDELPVWGS